tara:strand:- start:355 stop:633 length:279 start_codon:yes stop_codon:yes gene_type:complete
MLHTPRARATQTQGNRQVGGAPTSRPPRGENEADDDDPDITNTPNPITQLGKKLYNAINANYPPALLAPVLAALERYPIGVIRFVCKMECCI